jgi:acyl dehydratase
VTQPSVITDEMRAVIGRETEPQTVEVDRTAIRMFARAVGHTDPIYYDVEEARRRGYRDLPCPPAFLGTPVFNPGRAPRSPFSSFKSPYKRVLNGGTEVEYFDEDICAGDVLTSTTKLTDISERQGSMGPMLIIRSETTYRNQQGKVVAVMRGTAIQY